MKSLRLLLTLSFIVAFVSCSEDEPKAKVSGYFKLAALQSPNARSTANLDDAQETSFNLGVIKASREFYFLLANGGEADITEIELTTNNPAFIISPATISLLPAEGSASDALVPLISLGVEHGPKLNGVGYTSLLPMGTNSTTLTITGTTVENGETISLESTFTMTVDAKTMDVTLYSDNEEVDYDNFWGQHSGSEFTSGLPAIPSYIINPENLKIKNTGNIDFTVRVEHWASESQTDEFELAVNETKTISFPALITADSHLSLITVDSDGAVTQRARVKQGVDGRGYILVANPVLE